MADTLLTPTEILSETLMVLTDSMPAAMNVTRSYSDEFAKKGRKIGASVTYRLPVEFSVGTAMEIDVQDVEETSGTITIDSVANVAWDWESSDLKLTIDQYRERYINKAVIRLAHKIEQDLQQAMGRAFYNYVGTAGTTPASSGVIGDARQKLSEALCPDDRNIMIINGAAENELVDALSGLYNHAPSVSQQNISGAMKKLRGFDFYKSELVYRHTVGSHDSAVINGASQTGSTLNVDGADASTTDWLKAGDKFTIAGCNKCHPQTKQDMGVLQQFTVTADADTNGSGEAALSISPSIDASGPYQNVVASPTDGNALTILGTAATTYPFNLFFHPESTSLVMVDLPIPENVWGTSESYNGITLTMVKAFDIKTRREICRIDALYGIDVIRPQLGGVLIG